MFKAKTAEIIIVGAKKEGKHPEIYSQICSTLVLSDGYSRSFVTYSRVIKTECSGHYL